MDLNRLASMLPLTTQPAEGNRVETTAYTTTTTSVVRSGVR
ncbi:MAG TPA: hypothetical protein VHL58_14395 [Thermoanaerobaculia bacterium]|nr:hypothetical protein [Thermoanaerobaculia bacterium]